MSTFDLFDLFVNLHNQLRKHVWVVYQEIPGIGSKFKSQQKLYQTRTKLVFLPWDEWTSGTKLGMGGL